MGEPANLVSSGKLVLQMNWREKDRANNYIITDTNGHQTTTKFLRDNCNDTDEPPWLPSMWLIAHIVLTPFPTCSLFVVQ